MLRAAECEPGTPAVPRLPQHHDLVATGLQLAVSQTRPWAAATPQPLTPPHLRAPQSLRHEQMQTLFRDEELERALDDMYQRPLLETVAADHAQPPDAQWCERG